MDSGLQGLSVLQAGTAQMPDQGFSPVAAGELAFRGTLFIESPIQ
jgi:hypothetical protein